MTRNLKKSFRPSVLAASIASIGMAAAPWALAQDDEVRMLTTPESQVEVGVGYVSEDSTKFGDYTGLEDKGAFLIGNTYLNFRGDDARYLEIYGTDLGLDSRSLSVEGGQQGNYGVRLTYDELPHWWAHGFESPFLGLGSTSVSLPPGWERAPTTAPMAAQINANMRPFDLMTERKGLGLGFHKAIAGHWQFVANVKRETKEGNKPLGSILGNSGGNPRGQILPEPVDWTTDQVEAFARYSFEKLQMQFGYYGSFFRNAHSILNFQNPFAGTVWGGGAADFPVGHMSLPPDNEFHQLNASLGYTIKPGTRFSGTVSYGRATQDDAFLPYTVNPALAIHTPLPRSSLDGKVVYTNVGLNFNTRLMPKLALALKYRFNDRDNKTPQAEYWYIGGDSQNQTTGIDARRRTNLPTSSRKNQFHAELDYHLTPATKLKAGYEYDHVKKTFEAIDWEREHGVKLGVDHHFGETMSGGITYAYSKRKTSDYDAGAPFAESHNPLFVANQQPNAFDNAPNQKKYFLAPRTRDKVRAFFNVYPTEQLAVQLLADYRDDQYKDSELGLREATGWMAGVDANWVVSDTTSAHVFAAYDQYETDQRSVQLGGNRALFNDPNRFYSYDIEDRTVTWGAGLRMKPMANLEFGADFSQSDSKGKVDPTRASLVAGDGAALAPVTSFPDLTSKLRRLDLFATYRMRQDLAVKVQFIHERYRSDDWAYDDVAAAASSTPPNNGMANFIGTNQDSPDYTVNVIGVSLLYTFR